jgi:hypothetical protein
LKEMVGALPFVKKEEATVTTKYKHPTSAKQLTKQTKTCIAATGSAVGRKAEEGDRGTKDKQGAGKKKILHNNRRKGVEHIHKTS